MAARSKKVKLKNLASATKASVDAALGRELTRSLKPGGITAGIVMRDVEVANLTEKPEDVARTIAKQVRATSGISVTPQVTKFPGGIIMGYMIPRVMK